MKQGVRRKENYQGELAQSTEKIEFPMNVCNNDAWNQMNSCFLYVVN